MGSFETANALAILAGARNPQWVEQLAWTGDPDAINDGVYLEDTLHALIAVEVREEAHRRTARITFPTLDLAANYTVTINGTASVATGAHASRSALIDSLVTAINGSAIAAVVTASAADEDTGISGNDTVKIVGDSNSAWTITGSATGTGVMACIADPTSLTMRVWWLPTVSTAGTAPTAWMMSPDETYSLDRRGFIDRFDVAGINRAYVELADLAGAGDTATATFTIAYSNVEVWIGPCVTE